MSPVGPAHLLSAPLQNGVRLLPHPLPAAPWVTFACHCPAAVAYTVGGLRAYLVSLHTPRQHDAERRATMRGLGRASRPVAHRPWRRNVESPHLATYLLVRAWGDRGLSPFSSFGSTNITAFNSTSPELTLPRTPGPRPPCAAGSRRLRSRISDRLRRVEVTLSHGLQTKELPPMPAVVGDP
jgi:hypothetical protein